MSIQSDRWIREQAIEHRMIEPFSEKQVRKGVISCGLSSSGYDLRDSGKFKIFTNVNSALIDFNSVEYFRIPRDVLSICVGKST